MAKSNKIKIELDEKEVRVILNALAHHSASIYSRGVTKKGNVKPINRKEFNDTRKLELFFSELARS